VDHQIGVLLDEGPRGPSVIEVDVGEHEVAKIRDSEPAFGEAGPKRTDAAGGAAINERRLVSGQHVRTDDTFAPEVTKI
jgi:hypothetical protein